MSTLDFLSPQAAASDVRLVSPLARALEGAQSVRDVSSLGKVEVRGVLDGVELEPGEELVRITPSRGVLLTAGSAGAACARLRAAGLRAYDMTGALAALELDGERLLRRLTDLEPESLPAAGAVARGVPGIVQRVGGETFRILVPQELGHYVAAVALDAGEGLAR